jgi:hypothetical protein
MSVAARQQRPAAATPRSMTHMRSGCLLGPFRNAISTMRRSSEEHEMRVPKTWWSSSERAISQFLGIPARVGRAPAKMSTTGERRRGPRKHCGVSRLRALHVACALRDSDCPGPASSVCRALSHCEIKIVMRRPPEDFQAAATASRHVVIAAARSTR